MIRLAAATIALALAASSALACPWSQTSSVDTPSTTAAAQPTTTAPCPTCVVPDQGAAPRATPTQQTPS